MSAASALKWRKSYHLTLELENYKLRSPTIRNFMGYIGPGRRCSGQSENGASENSTSPCSYVAEIRALHVLSSGLYIYSFSSLAFSLPLSVWPASWCLR